jgi:NhaC family Na+:H+ antiporter
MSTAPTDTTSVAAIQAAIATQFNVGLHVLLPVVVVLGLVVAKMPAFPALLIGALTGCVFAVLFQ